MKHAGTRGFPRFFPAALAICLLLPSTTATTLAQTPTPTPVSTCIGDCRNDQTVTIDSLLVMVNVALGVLDVSSCLSGDVNHDGMITIDEILTAVGNAMNGCPHQIAFVRQSVRLSPHLPVSVAVADLNGDGLPDIATANNFDSVSVVVQQPDHTFMPAQESPLDDGGTEPTAIVSADINGDGRPDLIVANGGSNDVSVLLGQADHSFAPAAASPFRVTGSRPTAVAVADFNGDGLLDLATANEASDNVTVLLQQPNLTFRLAAGSPYAVGGVGPSGLAVADLDGDGMLDIVTANFQSSNLSILQGQVDHSFRLAAGTPLNVAGPTSGSLAVSAADLNGDGLTDLVAAAPGSGADVNNVFILLAQPDHTFRRGGLLSDPGGPVSIVILDMNGDGRQDIALADNFSDTVSVLLGQPDGSFLAAPGSPFAAGGHCPTAIVAADMNGDGHLDLLTVNEDQGPNDVTVLLGQPAGTFTAAPGSPFSVGGEVFPTSVAAADFDGDGTLDLVTANVGANDASIFLQGAGHRFTAAVESPFSVQGDEPEGIAIADLNGDGSPDIVTANRTSSTVSVLLSQPAHTFAPAPGSPFEVGAPQPTPTDPRGVAIADLNGDGILDIVTNNGYVLLGQPDHTFVLAPGSPFGGWTASVAVADLNGDGLLDLFAGSLLLGQGDGTLVSTANPPLVIENPMDAAVAIADLNNDGLPDLVATEGIWSYGMNVLFGQADHTFLPAPRLPRSDSDSAAAVAVADLDGDGLLDIVTANYYSNNISVFLGRRDRSFVLAPGSPFNAPALHPLSLVIADFDGDGLLDIATAGWGGLGVLFQVAH